MAAGSRRLPRCTKRRASAERSSVRRARSASASGVSARTSGRSASAAPSGSARSDSMLRTPIDSATRPQWDRELGGHAGERGDVVGIRAYVGRELCAPKPHRAPGDPALDRDAVRNHGVAALRDEPEPSVLEHEHRRHGARDGLVQGVDRCFDRLRRLVVSLDLVRSSLRRGSQQPGIDRAYDARSRRGMLHGSVIGCRAALLETRGPPLRTARYCVPRSLYQSRIASPQKSAITPPSARNGPSGIADFRASFPWRTNSTRLGRTRRRSRRTSRR